MLHILIKSIKNNFHIHFVFVLFFFWHCKEDSLFQPDPTFIPEISNLIAPSVVYNLSPQKHVISVKVADPQGVEDIAEVRYEITKTSSGLPTAQGNLLDAGEQGDIIPKDGIFTTQIDGSFTQGDSGDFDLKVFARDKSGNASSDLQARIMVIAGTENLPPDIIKVQVPTIVVVDSTFDFLVTVEVTDSDGLADIQKVIYQFYPPAHQNPTVEDTLSDSGESGDVTVGDGIYSTTLSSDIFEEASDYFLRFQAQDHSENKSAAVVAKIHALFRFPRSPSIANLVAPDTVKIDPNQVTKVVITLDVTDPQGLSDIAYVRFRSFLPDGREAQDSPFEMADDGNTAVTGDAVAGDGTYSIIINLPSSGVTPGDYKFIFLAKDKSDLFSNIIEHIMTVIE